MDLLTSKEEDEKADKAGSGRLMIIRDQGAQTSSQESPEHLRKGEEQQASATKL